MKIDPHVSAGKCRPMILVSRNIRIASIHVYTDIRGGPSVRGHQSNDNKTLVFMPASATFKYFEHEHMFITSMCCDRVVYHLYETKVADIRRQLGMHEVTNTYIVTFIIAVR